MKGEELIERVRAATGPDGWIDNALFCLEKGYDRLESDMLDSAGPRLYAYKGGKCFEIDADIPDYTSSVDAILALIERELPGWSPRLAKLDSGLWMADLVAPGLDANFRNDLATPALALCLAFLEARNITEAK